MKTVLRNFLILVALTTSGHLSSAISNPYGIEDPSMKTEDYLRKASREQNVHADLDFDQSSAVSVAQTDSVADVNCPKGVQCSIRKIDDLPSSVLAKTSHYIGVDAATPEAREGKSIRNAPGGN